MLHWHSLKARTPKSDFVCAQRPRVFLRNQSHSVPSFPHQLVLHHLHYWRQHGIFLFKSKTYVKHLLSLPTVLP